MPMFRFITHEDDETTRRDWHQTQQLQPTALTALPSASSSHAPLEQPSSSVAAALSISSLASVAAASSNQQRNEASSHGTQAPAATVPPREPLPTVQQAKTAPAATEHEGASLKRVLDVSESIKKPSALEKKVKKEPVDKDKAKELKAAETNMTKMISELQCSTSQAIEISDAIKHNGKWKWLSATPQFSAFTTAFTQCDEAKAAYPVVKTLLTNGNKLGHRHTKRFNRAVAVFEKHVLLYKIEMLSVSKPPCLPMRRNSCASASKLRESSHTSSDPPSTHPSVPHFFHAPRLSPATSPFLLHRFHSPNRTYKGGVCRQGSICDHA